MLGDDLLRERYRRRLERLLDLAEREIVRTDGTPFAAAAAAHLDLIRRAAEAWDRERGDLLGAFRRLAPHGIEVATTAATHAFLPLLEAHPPSVRAQVIQGVRSHRRVFGADPAGFWLPECGFMPGHDAVLAAAGVRYTFLDAHGILLGRPRPRHGVFAPVRTPAGPAAFGRDMESSRQVWSAEEGYPGDAAYREFHRDLGHDAEYEYVRPLLPGGVRTSIGLKYHRVTGPVGLEAKEPYDPAAAEARARAHAAHFVGAREEQARRLAAALGRPPVVVAPYDAELFGHWWFEGPIFLEEVLRLAARSEAISLATPSEVLDRSPPAQMIAPSFSSWGNRGYAEVWLNPSNDWIWPAVHRAGEEMSDLVERFPSAAGLEARALAQAAREVLLAQASDWPFMLSAGATAAYARRRVDEHLDRFRRLREMLVEGRVDEAALGRIEACDNIFPEIDPRDFMPVV